MTPRTLMRALGVLAVTSVLALLPASAGAAPLTVGVQSDNMLLADPATREAELDRIDGTGAQVVRVTLAWRLVASNAEVCRAQSLGALYSQANPCYQWGTYDHLVAEAKERGLPVLFSVFQVPGWVLGASGANGWRWMGSSDREFDRVLTPKWAAFAAAAASRYGPSSPYGHVRRWTVGNEPNSSFFWQPQNASAPKRYARLYRAVAPAIVQANRNAMVAPGPTGPRPPKGKPINFWRTALPIMQRNGSGKWISAVAHNAYAGAPRSPRSLKTKAPSVDVTNMQDLYRELDKYRATRKKQVWVLEFAYQTNPPDRIFGVGWSDQATYLAQGWDMLNDGRTRMAIWYVLRDPADQVDWQSGLWDQRGGRKPSLAMFMRPVASHAGRVGRGQTVRLFGMSMLRPGRQTLKYSYNGRTWKTVPGQRRSGTTVRANFRPTRSFKVRTVDPGGPGPYRNVRVG
jgi:hypothetical protein